MNRAQKVIEKLFAEADVQIGGDRPWDIKVHNDEFYPRVLEPWQFGAW